MTTVAQLMTSPVSSIGPQESLRRAAALMRELDVGGLPVCHAGRLLGMVTDRDIATRGVAEGLTPDGGCVSDVMSPASAACHASDGVALVLQRMSDHRLRRLPVLDGDDRLVGLVSLADVALGAAAGDEAAQALVQALRHICQPTGTRLAARNAGRSRTTAV